MPSSTVGRRSERKEDAEQPRRQGAVAVGAFERLEDEAALERLERALEIEPGRWQVGGRGRGAVGAR